MTRPSDLVLERLFRLHPKKIDLSLDRMTALLARLGHPERRLPPAIHVAGTNGKGSTTAYLRAILEAEGLKVHVYSSPHLVRFAERIRLAGKIIAEDRLYRHLVEVEELNGDVPITYFEITTAIALRAFAKYPADVLLLEVGLGGRLDATNVIDQPLACVITPVSVDHEQFLGADLAGIAREKAGIAKAGRPLILAQQSPPALAAIRATAANAHARVTAYGDWTVRATAEGFSYEDEKGTLSLPRPNLQGPHQIHNAGLAIACLRHQDWFDISDEAIHKGVISAEWPARLQNITDSSLGQILPAGSELWLDGGHNPAAGQILADHFKPQHDLPLFLICGMMANKDVTGFLTPLAPLVRRLYGLSVPGEDSHTAADISEFAQKCAIEALADSGASDALEDIAARAEEKPVRVLICGSLYLAGQILDQTDLLPT